MWEATRRVWNEKRLDQIFPSYQGLFQAAAAEVILEDFIPTNFIVIGVYVELVESSLAAGLNDSEPGSTF